MQGCNIILRGALAQREIDAWFRAFMTSPLAYHSLSYAVGVHQQIRGTPASPQRLQRTLQHKGQAISFVNQSLRDLHNTDVAEMSMLAIYILWRHNLPEAARHHEGSMLFHSHLPSANWLSVYGRTDAVDQHAIAIKWLVEASGGLHAIRTPGLGSIIAM